MKRRLVATLCALLVLAAALPTLAFDGDRRGFILNLGAGVGRGEVEASSGPVSASLDGSGFTTAFKIGGGLGPQTLLYYTNRALWYSFDVFDPFSGRNYTAKALNGMSAVAVSYFLEPQAPSVFFSGGLGVGVVTDRDASESESGLGVTLGLGFEFAPNWVIEGTYQRAKVDEQAGVDFVMSNVMVTVSWLAY